MHRASLYYRFPGGKAQMAAAALERAAAHHGAYVLAPLAEPGDPARRVQQMACRLSEFYDRGRQWCLLDTLAIGNESEEIRTRIEQWLRAWLDAMEGVAREAGLTARAAKLRAEQALVNIQGTLVVARGTGDCEPFDRTLQNLPDLLTLSRNRE